jgi:hypothetical protein
MDMPADGDLVYVPARPVCDGAEREPAIELRRLRDSDERVGLAFTSPQELVETLGECQPWISMPMYSYVAWLRMQGVYRVQVDPCYADDVSQWSADRLTDAVQAVS